jgi:hypothetical protein
MSWWLWADSELEQQLVHLWNAACQPEQHLAVYLVPFPTQFPLRLSSARARQMHDVYLTD